MELARQEGCKGLKRGSARAEGARRGWCDARETAQAVSGARGAVWRSEGGGERRDGGGGKGAGTIKREERVARAGAGWARGRAEGAEAERWGAGERRSVATNVNLNPPQGLLRCGCRRGADARECDLQVCWAGGERSGGCLEGLRVGWG